MMAIFNNGIKTDCTGTIQWGIKTVSLNMVLFRQKTALVYFNHMELAVLELIMLLEFIQAQIYKIGLCKI